jgi:hypothetical protein
VDPLAPKYPHNSPYAFSENRLIDGVELEGLEVRIYNDLSGLPHSFISVVDDDGLIHVFTYGQYGQKGIELAGKGALVHLVGEDANKYINYEFEQYKDKMSVYEISEEYIDKQKIIDYYLKEIEENNIPAEKVGEHAPTFVNEEYGSEAVLYKYYALIPDGHFSKNCTSVTLDGIDAGGYEIWSSYLPWDLNGVLGFRSLFGQTKDVTQDEKKSAENNENSGSIIINLPEIIIKAD